MVRGDLSKGEAVKVVFYGRLADAFGPEMEIDASPGWSVADLRDKLIAAYPEAGEALRNKRVRACVGDALVRESFVLGADERIEFLPPVSGG